MSIKCYAGFWDMWKAGAVRLSWRSILYIPNHAHIPGS